MKDLTLKTAMLLALIRPSRSADLHGLDIGLLRSSPEGISFLPSKPAKQTRGGKVAQEFCFPRFEEKPVLCPVRAVGQYMKATGALRAGNHATQLFIAYIKPHSPVTSSTIVR